MAIMRCPKCGKTTLKKVEHDGGFHMECRSCDWGRQADESQSSHTNESLTWSILVLRWLLVVVVLVGPYFGLELGLQELAKKSNAVVHIPVLYYCGVMVVYLLISLFVNPIPDHSEMGLWGTMRDDPRTYRDNVNRQLLFWQMVLTPGKFVIDTAWKTGEKLFHRQDHNQAE